MLLGVTTLLLASLVIRPCSATDNDNDSVLLCRLTMQDTLFQDEDTGRFYGQEEIVCDPQNNNDNGMRNDLLYTIPALPATLLPHGVTPAQVMAQDQQEDNDDDVWIQITAAYLDEDTEQVVTDPALSTFTVVSFHRSRNNEEPQDDDPEQEWDLGLARRRLKKKAYDLATGVRTYAVILIATQDVPTSFTATAVRERFTNTTVGLQAQYAACSANQLQWQLQGVYTVNLPQKLEDYGHAPSTVRNEATAQFLNDHSHVVSSMEELADNVLYCIPPGTGNWVANAGTFYWRSQYNGAWCMSLTAVVVSGVLLCN